LEIGPYRLKKFNEQVFFPNPSLLQGGNMFEIVIDTGGTFTDAVLLDEARKISMAKYPTNAEDPSKSIMGCIAALAQQRDMKDQQLLRNTDTLVIGTTLPTNTIVEKKGAKCCLLYTNGFRDIPELGRRIPKDEIYNLKLPAPESLISRSLRFGVRERIQFNGDIVTPLNEKDVLDAVRKAKRQGVEVPIVCFLHSYINPSHEEKAGEIIKKEYPNVVLSSHILRRWMEWDRLSTAMIAGSVKPVVARFIESLDRQLKGGQFRGTYLFTTCIGGVAAPELCLDNPALLIGSGPAAGPLLGRFLANLCNFENVIVADMGGTTFDISMLPGATVNVTPEMRVGDFINALESVDVVSAGAGGGSIASVDARNILQVGPSSAGADPGPACYRKGGQAPTVTDADVILGYIPADFFLGGSIVLDADLAKNAVEKNVAKPLGLDLISAAHAISALVEDNMAQGIFLSAVERGLDPREFTLVAGGGAGPVHATSMASRLGISQVYIPRQAAAFCALGAALANYEYVLNLCIYRSENELRMDELKGWYKTLETEGANTLRRQGLTKEEMKLARGAEMRYLGQLRDIVVFLPENRKGEPFTDETLRELIKGFHEKHQAIYGWSDPAMTVAISTLKLRAIGVRRPIELIKQPYAGQDASAALKRRRQVYFKDLGGFIETPCYDANQLKHGNVLEGPGIVEDSTTTVVVPKGATLTVDAYHNYTIKIRRSS
jgi:N-methylhydantoinase A